MIEFTTYQKIAWGIIMVFAIESLRRAETALNEDQMQEKFKELSPESKDLVYRKLAENKGPLVKCYHNYGEIAFKKSESDVADTATFEQKRQAVEQVVTDRLEKSQDRDLQSMMRIVKLFRSSIHEREALDEFDKVQNSDYKSAVFYKLWDLHRSKIIEDFYEYGQEAFFNRKGLFASREEKAQAIEKVVFEKLGLISVYPVLQDLRKYDEPSYVSAFKNVPQEIQKEVFAALYRVLGSTSQVSNYGEIVFNNLVTETAAVFFAKQHALTQVREGLDYEFHHKVKYLIKRAAEVEKKQLTVEEKKQLTDIAVRIENIREYRFDKAKDDFFIDAYVFNKEKRPVFFITGRGIYISIRTLKNGAYKMPYVVIDYTRWYEEPRVLLPPISDLQKDGLEVEIKWIQKKINNIEGIVQSIWADLKIYMILQEHCDCSLDILLKDSFISLSSDNKLQIALDVVKGLNYLHTQDPHIIHRDIKPGNILLKAGRARLADFGGCMHHNDAQANFEGTELYFPPEVLSAIDNYIEQRRNKELITLERRTADATAMPSQNVVAKVQGRRADIFSLGIVFLQLHKNEVPQWWEKKDEKRGELIELIKKVAKPLERFKLFYRKDLHDDMGYKTPGIRRTQISTFSGLYIYMLQNKPEDRPYSDTVLDILDGISKNPNKVDQQGVLL